MPSDKAPRLYVAKDSFSGVFKDGTPYVVNPGQQPMTENDERFRANPEMFLEYQPVEQTTAAPGERRNR
jgi:hypothetical protein